MLTQYCYFTVIFILIDITNFYVLKQYVKFATPVWNNLTKHRKGTWLTLQLKINNKQTLNKLSYLRNEKNLVKIMLM